MQISGENGVGRGQCANFGKGARLQKNGEMDETERFETISRGTGNPRKNDVMRKDRVYQKSKTGVSRFRGAFRTVGRNIQW